MKVKELMIKDVFVVTGDDTVFDAASIMIKYDVGLLVVVEDTITKRPTGIISDRDIIVEVVMKNLNPTKTHVKDVMNKEIIATSSNEELSKAIDKMKKNKVKRLPVIDDGGNLTGIISYSDVVKKFAEFKKKLVEFAIDF